MSVSLDDWLACHEIDSGERTEFYTALPARLSDEEAEAEARRRGRRVGGFAGPISLERHRLWDGLQLIVARVEAGPSTEGGT